MRFGRIAKLSAQVRESLGIGGRGITHGNGHRSGR
jgi:hypothetical protein